MILRRGSTRWGRTATIFRVVDEHCLEIFRFSARLGPPSYNVSHSQRVHTVPCGCSAIRLVSQLSSTILFSLGSFLDCSLASSSLLVLELPSPRFVQAVFCG